MLFSRRKRSHKGDHGRVLVIGGNEVFHGAPLYAALGAEHTGVDLVRLMVPRTQKTLARRWSLHFIAHTFRGEHLVLADAKAALQLAAKSDVIVMGMGLGRKSGTARAVSRIICGAPCKLVLDADALTPATEYLVGDAGNHENIVLTPHLGEAREMLEMLGVADNWDMARDTPALRKSIAQFLARTLKTTCVLKGYVDYVAGSDGSLRRIAAGNAGLTKGGTGDLLAGVIGGLMAQGLSPARAGYHAVRAVGRAAYRLKRAKHYSYTTEDVARHIIV